MSDDKTHAIRQSIGKVVYWNTQNDNEGKADIESIAREHNVSEDQVRDQMEFLRSQNLIRGPLANEGLQVREVPGHMLAHHTLTEDGLAWADAGYPVL